MAINKKPTAGTMALANAIMELSWSEMADFAEAIANEVPHLARSEALNRDGVAQMLHDLADEVFQVDGEATRP